MSDRHLLLVTGPGRSGTSAVAGALAHAGFHVPQAIRGREANPRGYFEPRWLVNFHKDRLRSAGVGTLDPDPEARSAVEASPDIEAARSELRSWLAEQLEAEPRLVLKDPRLIWFYDLWTDVAQELGIDISFLIMLRHPAEVSSSRSTYYAADHVRAASGWINVVLMTERLTRGYGRTLLHYPDLLADWRTQLRRTDEQLRLDLQPPITQASHPIDEFLDPSLRRMPSGWDALDVPSALRDLADRTFVALKAITDGEPEDHAALDALHEEYSQLYAAALVLSEARRARQKARRRAVERHTEPAVRSGLRLPASLRRRRRD